MLNHDESPSCITRLRRRCLMAFKRIQNPVATRAVAPTFRITIVKCHDAVLTWQDLMGSRSRLPVFVIGFALGAIRVLLLVPRLGETAAVSLETPFMLAASWNLSRWSAKEHDVLTDTTDALLMGAIALVVLTLAELGTAVLLFRRTVLEYFVGFGSVPGAIGLAGQLCFASFPFLQGHCNRIESSS